MPKVSSAAQLSSNDGRLIEEAIRRLASRTARQIDHDLMKATLTKEIARGRRDLFSLTRAGQRALDSQ